MKIDYDFGFEFFFGVVEDRKDPLEIGRIRVRVFGKHTSDKIKDNEKGIPTEELLWAQPISPVTSASNSGVGDSSLGLVENSMVFGFYVDSPICQQGYIIGSIPGIPVDMPNPALGFNDPNGVYPRFVGESDIPRLARSSFRSSSQYSNKQSGLVTGIPTAMVDVANTGADGSSDKPGEKWSELPSSQATIYPYNKVRVTESGHAQEFDDTPGAERIHTFHRTGTYEEWRPDGTSSRKIVGDDIEIVVGNRKMLVGANETITIIGNAQLMIHGNLSETVKGNVTRIVKGNVTEKIEGNYSRDVIGNLSENTTGNVTVRDGSNRSETTMVNKTKVVGANETITVNGAQTSTIIGDSTATVAGNSNYIVGGKYAALVSGPVGWNTGSTYGTTAASYSLGTTGDISIDSGSHIGLMGPRIDLN